MANQNFKNHGRYILLWHFITPSVLLILIVMSIISLVHSHKNAYDLHLWLPLILIPVVMLIFWWYIRLFALKAQDRAIRAEENFRNYIITGKPLDNRLRMSQIIALRFASDDEVVAFAARAADEKLSQKDIKLAIKNWKADYNRA